MKKTTIYFICIFLISMLSGCLTKNSEIYGSVKVYDYVDDICDEPYRLVSKKLIEKTPDNMEYSFVTLNRNLTFTANSYLSPISIDASTTSFYDRAISCNYVSVVHDLYMEDLYKVLKKYDLYLPDQHWMYVTDFTDINTIVEAILEADQIYKTEEQFHESKEFLVKYPLSSIHLVWQRSKDEALEHRTWVNLTDIAVNGQNTESELYDKLAHLFAQKYIDGDIENGRNIPEEYLKSKHVSTLSTIKLNDVEMLYDTEENPYNAYSLTTDDYKFCWYSQSADSYMMVIDIGFLSDNMSIPLIIREYVYALGGSYDAAPSEKGYISHWTIGNDTWEMKSEMSDGAIAQLEITKNGVPLNIDYFTVDEERSIGATFCAGLTVDDFCQLFNITWNVQESKDTIYFYSIQ